MASRARRPCPLQAARAACVGGATTRSSRPRARAYLKDLPHAEFHMLDTGHFVTATHSVAIADPITAFLSRVVAPATACGAGANQRRARSDQRCRAGRLVERSRREHLALGAFNVDNQETLQATARATRCQQRQRQLRPPLCLPDRHGASATRASRRVCAREADRPGEPAPSRRSSSPGSISSARRAKHSREAVVRDSVTVTCNPIHTNPFVARRKLLARMERRSTDCPRKMEPDDRPS